MLDRMVWLIAHLYSNIKVKVKGFFIVKKNNQLF